MIISVVLWLVAVALVVIFVGRAWSLGSLAAKGRGQLVRTGVDAVVALALVRALVPPPGLGAWVWVAAAVAVGIGVAGIILGWPNVPADRRRWP
ncbi:MAG: hypothetical protein L0H41_12045, partial [Microlunatus sp.]|nr:hypothetical protein [Microlunatus sp.]